MCKSDKTGPYGKRRTPLAERVGLTPSERKNPWRLSGAEGRGFVLTHDQTGEVRRLNAGTHAEACQSLRDANASSNK